MCLGLPSQACDLIGPFRIEKLVVSSAAFYGSLLDRGRRRRDNELNIVGV